MYGCKKSYLCSLTGNLTKLASFSAEHYQARSGLLMMIQERSLSSLKLSLKSRTSSQTEHYQGSNPQARLEGRIAKPRTGHPTYQSTCTHCVSTVEIQAIKGTRLEPEQTTALHRFRTEKKTRPCRLDRITKSVPRTGRILPFCHVEQQPSTNAVTKAALHVRKFPRQPKFSPVL